MAEMNYNLPRPKLVGYPTPDTTLVFNPRGSSLSRFDQIDNMNILMYINFLRHHLLVLLFFQKWKEFM